ncbi:unnamed protein product [Pleuronectes platessa]|uniref:Uncharacterized protein n=1 Tax=Pleuronectes platessa TaxID=8262 RepID=A0A9N7VET9_PLEPL|nr:unnamed protein product [Pleuronectes platessa]
MEVLNPSEFISGDAHLDVFRGSSGIQKVKSLTLHPSSPPLAAPLSAATLAPAPDLPAVIPSLPGPHPFLCHPSFKALIPSSVIPPSRLSCLCQAATPTYTQMDVNVRKPQ